MGVGPVPAAAAVRVVPPFCVRLDAAAVPGKVPLTKSDIRASSSSRSAVNGFASTPLPLLMASKAKRMASWVCLEMCVVLRGQYDSSRTNRWKYRGVVEPDSSKRPRGVADRVSDLLACRGDLVPMTRPVCLSCNLGVLRRDRVPLEVED